jgi:hypothetical protein
MSLVSYLQDEPKYMQCDFIALYSKSRSVQVAKQTSSIRCKPVELTSITRSHHQHIRKHPAKRPLTWQPMSAIRSLIIMVLIKTLNKAGDNIHCLAKPQTELTAALTESHSNTQLLVIYHTDQTKHQ